MSVIFVPWVGANYGKNTSLFTVKVMVLGDSPNCDECPDCGNPDKMRCSVPATFTTRTINTYLDPSLKMKKGDYNWRRTYSSFINALRGKTCSREERKQVMHSIVFYNYLQRSAGKAARQTYRHDYSLPQYRKALNQIVEQHQPTVIFCWGKNVWRVISAGITMGRPLIIHAKPFSNYISYETDNGFVCQIVGVKHPSAGFMRAYNYELMSAFIK